MVAAEYQLGSTTAATVEQGLPLDGMVESGGILARDDRIY